jgi:hypothetical protein
MGGINCQLFLCSLGAYTFFKSKGHHTLSYIKLASVCKDYTNKLCRINVVTPTKSMFQCFNLVLSSIPVSEFVATATVHTCFSAPPSVAQIFTVHYRFVAGC